MTLVSLLPRFVLCVFVFFTLGGTVCRAGSDGIVLDPIPVPPPIPAPPTSSPTLRPTASPTVTQEPSSAPVPTLAPTTVDFFVLGDVPYSDMEACLLPFELDKLDVGQGQFVVHVGDIRDGALDPITSENRDCPESYFQDLAVIFESSDVTPFFVPGDNGWLDCKNATEAYEFWETYLFRYNERTDLAWSTSPFAVNRWDTFPPEVGRTTRRTEFFSFLIDNVLFIGLSLPGDGRDEDNEWTPRDSLIQDNIEWTRDNFDAYAGDYSAVVIFGHSFGSSINFGYNQLLPSIVTDPAYGVPPVLLIQDWSSLIYEEEYIGVANLARIRQENTVTPLQVKVDPSASGLSNVFQYDQRCLCSNNHRPTQTVNYLPPSPCAGACAEGSAACQGQNTCSPENATC